MCTAQNSRVELKSWVVYFTIRTRETLRTIRDEARYLAVSEDDARRLFAEEWGYLEPEIEGVMIERD